MLMNTTTDLINTIVSELVNPDVQLRHILLKVQVLAYRIENDNFKEWVKSEQEGFIGKPVPSYRRQPTIVRGNLMQDRGFAGYATQNSATLPIEYLDARLSKSLRTVEMTASASELEAMIEAGVEFQMPVPHMLFNEISKLYANNWHVESAWKVLPQNCIIGIVSKIKSTLLTFLLDVAAEIGEGEKIDIEMHRGRINEIFDRTLNNVTGSVINITVGNSNVSTFNTGDNANVIGTNEGDVRQTVTNETYKELEKFILELGSQLDELTLREDDRSDVELELSRMQAQLTRTQPKHPIINESLRVVNTILLGVVGNVLTPPILEKLTWLLTMFHSTQ
jgi:hypothetical protein